MAVTQDQEQVLTCNDVRLVGRLSRAAVERALPSGDVLVAFVLVVDRSPPGRRRSSDGSSRPAGARTPTQDSLDCVAWAAGVRRTALRLLPGDVVEVTGSLRRRFWRAGSTTASRYEVEAARIRKVASS